MPENGEFSLSFEFFPRVLSIFIEFLEEIFRIYLENFTLQFFKMYFLNFGPKMPENEDFCLSFELFS